MYVFRFKTPEGVEFTSEIENYEDGMSVQDVEDRLREEGEVPQTWETLDAYEYTDFTARDAYDEYTYEDDDEYIPSSSRGDYGPSDPWNAPGMKVSDFISGVRW